MYVSSIKWKMCPKAMLPSWGGNSNTNVSILLASSSTTRPTVTTLEPSLGSERGDKPSEGDKSQYSRYFGNGYLLWRCICATFGDFLYAHKIARANKSSLLLLALIFSKYHTSFVSHLIRFFLNPQVQLYPPKVDLCRFYHLLSRKHIKVQTIIEKWPSFTHTP